MKTEDLIKLMSEDTRRPVNVTRAVVFATITGGLLAAVAFFSALGFRPDIGEAAETFRFLFKFVVTLSLAAAALGLVQNMVRPGSDLKWWRVSLLIPAALLLAAVGLELFSVPSQLWEERLIGQNAIHCLMVIPLLSIFPATFLFLAMRHGAPENPGIAGIAASLVAAGIAASLYASSCPDDSPLFVAAWYPIATLIVAVVGYFAGKRFLRW